MLWSNTDESFLAACQHLPEIQISHIVLIKPAFAALGEGLILEFILDLDDVILLAFVDARKPVRLAPYPIRFVTSRDTVLTCAQYTFSRRSVCWHHVLRSVCEQASSSSALSGALLMQNSSGSNWTDASTATNERLNRYQVGKICNRYTTYHRFR